MPHATGDLQPSQVKSISVYDVANYGTDLFLPLTDVGLTETALTFSTATVTRDTSNSNQPLDSFPRVYSDTDSGLLLNEGNNTIYNQTYSFSPDMTAIIYKISLQFCACLTVSAYTSGTYNLGSLHIKIKNVQQMTAYFMKILLFQTLATEQAPVLTYIGSLRTLLKQSK